MREKLPFRVDVRGPSDNFAEDMSAFNVEAAAISYASLCAHNRPGFVYRVRRGSKILHEYKIER